MTERGLVEAPKLDAIPKIVNMPERTRDLRCVAMP
jgi:hypothetical protein